MNLHTHTDFCDGKSSPEDFVKKAISLEFKYLGFSAHAPLPFLCDWSLPTERLDSYCVEIARLKAHYQKKLQILHGFEIDFLEGMGFPCLTEDAVCGADFFICSIHFLKTPQSAITSPKFAEIDGNYAQFMLAMKSHQYSLKKILSNYLNATEQMILTPLDDGMVKIIGHVDKIVLNAKQLPEFEGLSEWFYEELFNILIQHRGHYHSIEINTRALYKKGLSQPYPRYNLLEMLANQNVPLIINSDAHHPSELNAGYKETVERLESLTTINIKNLHYKWLKR